MEIPIDRDDYYHWLFYDGTLPINVSHLQLCCDYYSKGKFRLPNSVFSISKFQEKVFQFIPNNEYYDQEVSRESLPFHPALKSITLSKCFTEYYSINTFPSTLESLDITDLNSDNNNNLSLLFKYIPSSLTSLKCESLPKDGFSAHLKLNHLQYSIKQLIEKIVFTVTDRSITKDNVPTMFNKLTGFLDPQPTNIIQELVWKNHNFSINNAQVSLYNCMNCENDNYFVLKSEQSLESKILPFNYPDSLREITLSKPMEKGQFYSIPSTIKVLKFVERNIKNLILPNYKFVIDEPIKQKTNNQNINTDLFFKILRNQYLKIKIYDKISPKLIHFLKTKSKKQKHSKSSKKNKDQVITHLQPIPESTESLEIKFTSTFDLNNLQDKIPASLKRVVISDKILMGDTIQQIPTFLYRRNLLDQVYQIYKPGEEISNTTTVLIWRENQAITHGIIPHGVKKIIFGHTFNQAIIKDTLPGSVNQIVFGNDFSQCFSNIHLPESVKSLSLRKYYPNLNPDIFPKSILYLYFLSYTHGRDFIQFFSKLPKSITHLSFKCKKLGGGRVTPFQIQKHHFKIKYPSIECLIEFILNRDYDNDSISIDNNNNNQINNNNNNNIIVPSSEIHLNYESDSPIPVGSLDHLNIKSIVFSSSYNQALPKGSLPNTITRLMFENFNQFVFSPPLSLKHLFLKNFNQSLNSNMLPTTLESLYLVTNKEIPIGVIPHGLKCLFLGPNNHEIKQGVIPNTVEQLEIEMDNNLNTKSIPYGVSILKLRGKGTFKHGSIPNSVTKLFIDATYISLEEGSIPNSVTSLTLSKQDKKPLDLEQLPKSIKSLSLSFDGSFYGKIPLTIENLTISNYTKPIRSDLKAKR
ncbi:hypothetical protein CYY_004224 [Polysphondylium violaceum]|uniref:FNIP repeat-containing protein n=1 Tax=Polysphondylium violaceum TaxID=133409 RepID=A0A8J4PXD1_9MYCE|nr:hypothetical protein CYY_004224 [Polysphondylium violaceum]